MPDDPNLQTPAPTPAATPEPAPPAAASNPGPPAGDPPLGPAGESALRAERARATQLERQLAEERRTRTEGVGQDQQTLERQLAEERRLRLEAERRGESAEEQPAGHVPGLPNVPLHHGPRQPAQLSEDEMHARAMKNVFPQAAFANGTDPD
jgi:hypothetical protein